ncbi:hypothetical protein, partial [Pseudobutyrivibrio ruminis]
MSGLSNKIFYYLVESKPEVFREYVKYCQTRENASFFASGIMALKFNIDQLIKARERKIKRLKYPETIKKNQKNIKEYYDLIESVEIVSFDIFDTVIFRPFDHPTDLFFLVGARLQIPEFKYYRIQAEKVAREKSNNHNEVTLEDIYRVLKEWFGDKCDCNVEKQMEYELCYANPFMQDVFQYAKEKNKKIIFTSDMYLSSDDIKKMIEKCKYMGDYELFVSNEIGLCKRDGSLQNFINKKYEGKQILHIGDDYEADIVNGKKAQWKVIHYKNVNGINNQYRPYYMDGVVGSIYKAIVNTYFYNSSKNYSLAYEYGFTCGGIMIWAFCQWLNELCKTEKIDRILFVARDGKMISEIYNKYFDDVGEYIWFSRTSSEKLVINDWFEDYVNQNVKSEFCVEKQNEPICGLLKFLGLDFLKDVLIQEGIELSLPRCKLGYKRFREFMYQNKEHVVERFLEAQENGKDYLVKSVYGKRKVCVVDSGWRGSSIVYLRHLLTQTYGLNMDIVGALVFSDMQDYSEGFKALGIIKSFM